MDSDSSLEEERNRNRFPIRPNMNDNSDVSDEENISRAARSIESPPESPQGTHFESPPASPDPENNPATPSPIQSPEDSASYESPNKSPESQNDSRNLKNDSPPKSPDSFVPRSPSQVRFMNRTPPSDPRSQSPTTNYPRSPSPTTNYPRSPSPIHSQSSNPSFRNKSPASPAQPRSPQSPNSIQSTTRESRYAIRSPSQRSQSPNSLRSPSPYRRGEVSRSSPQSSSPRQRSPRMRRNSNNSDDGRSNISSASSFSSPGNSPVRRPPSPPPPAAPIKSHAEDLSDVSDLDSLNSMSDDESEVPKEKISEVSKPVNDTKKEAPSVRNTSSGGLDADDTEQLDFEAEEKEEGECDVTVTAAAPAAVTASKEKKEGKKDSDDEGELKGDELEEGEISDEGENRPEETEPRPVCRFYNRGQCTWGSSCRFVHPGVTDKGNYTMFEMVRPLVPVNGPLMYGPPPMDPYRPPMVPMERPMMGPPPVHYPPQGPPPVRKEEVAAPPVAESAWERGLRQAKEMLRKSSKRKETEVDFEEKKMNLSIGQDDLDKENDYYSRTASPVAPDDPAWSGSKPEGESKRYRTMSERFDDYGGGPEGYYYQQNRNTEQVWHQRPHYDESMRSIYTSSRSSSKYYESHPPRSRTSREKEYYREGGSSSKRSSKYNQREVIVQRAEKPASWKEDSPVTKPARYAEGRGGGGRGDEWADPWMRAKTSPQSRKQRSRKASYSSGSSYSSSSSSRSSRSSSSSYSRSSRSRSRSKKPSKLSPPRRPLRPSPPQRGPKVAMVGLPVEKKPPPSMMMNPPPPSPKGKGKIIASNPSPPMDRMRPGVPARISKAASAVAAAMRSTRSRSKSSRSGSSSDSSGSSSDSSESSLSSSSSIHQKRIVIDERLALAQAMNMKVKAMDALKLSGQKQQIKLTLKGSGDRTVTTSSIAGKKRPADSPPLEFSPPKTNQKKTAPSRREELLKQLKAVEDAIARKRSKIS